MKVTMPSKRGQQEKRGFWGKVFYCVSHDQTSVKTLQCSLSNLDHKD